MFDLNLNNNHKMHVNEFIWSEIKLIIVKNTKLNNTEKEKILSFLNMFDKKELDKDILKYLLSELNPFSSELKSLFKILNLFLEINDSEFNKELLSKTEKLSEIHKQNDLLIFIWIKLKVLQFEHDEYLDVEYAKFLQKVFTEHCPLTGKIDKFSEVTGIILKPKWEIWNSDIFKEPLKKIITECKFRYEIKLILAKIYFHKYEYDKSLQMLNEIKVAENIKRYVKSRTVNLPDKEYFSYADYIDTIQIIAIIQSIKGEDRNAYKNADFVLKNLPNFNTPDKDIYQKIFYMDSYFIRMRYNIKNGNKGKVLKDYTQVRDLIEISDWNDRYKDVTEYLEN